MSFWEKFSQGSEVGTDDDFIELDGGSGLGTRGGGFDIHTRGDGETLPTFPFTLPAELGGNGITPFLALGPTTNRVGDIGSVKKDGAKTTPKGQALSTRIKVVVSIIIGKNTRFLTGQTTMPTIRDPRTPT